MYSIPLLRGEGVWQNAGREGCVIKRIIIPYNPKLKEVAKKLRKKRVLSEVLLWKELKRKKMMGYDFHRQKPLKDYIVDFFCQELMLVIEIDGDSHNDETAEYDEKRQKDLEGFGLTFLRYYDGYVKNYLSDVVNSIRAWIIEHGFKDINTPRPDKSGHPS